VTVPLLNPLTFIVVETPDQPMIPISGVHSSKSESVNRGEMRRELDTPAIKSKTEDLSKIREAHQKEKAAGRCVRPLKSKATLKTVYSSARQTEIERMEAEVKRLARGRDGGDSEEERNTKKTKNKSHLEEELAKYEKGRGVRRKGHKKDESNVLAALAGFRSKLQTAKDDDEMMDVSSANDEMVTQSMEGVEGEAVEVDNDLGFMGHSLQFPKGNEEEVQKAERDYEVIDPRARGAQARQEERERKAKAAKQRKGGRR